jgi:hypothetical protein
MFWSILQFAASAALAIYAAGKDTKSRWAFSALVLVILIAGVASVLKDSNDSADVAALKKETEGLRGEVASREKTLEKLQRTSLDRISQLQSKLITQSFRKS